jgi:hypothetical protein
MESEEMILAHNSFRDTEENIEALGLCSQRTVLMSGKSG